MKLAWRVTLTLTIGLGVVSLTACSKAPVPPDIPFGPTGEAALGFNELQGRFPLDDAARKLLTQENIELFNQEQIDQIYVRINAGPIPDGPYRGSFFFSEGAEFRNIADVVGGLRGRVVDLKLDKLTAVGELLWRGKVFYKQKRELRNIIDKERVVAKVFDVPVERMRRETVFGEEVALLFPAKLYKGASQLDPRRPSVIIDYAETAEIDGYIPEIDSLGGKDGLQIRDEIRMIRPGFYLGRAYFGTLFGLNFTLYNEDVANAAAATGD